MLPFPFFVIEDKDRFLRRSLRLTGPKCGIHALTRILCVRSIAEIKYWHTVFPFYLKYRLISYDLMSITIF